MFRLFFVIISTVTLGCGTTEFAGSTAVQEEAPIKKAPVAAVGIGSGDAVIAQKEAAPQAIGSAPGPGIEETLKEADTAIEGQSEDLEKTVGEEKETEPLLEETAVEEPVEEGTESSTEETAVEEPEAEEPKAPEVTMLVGECKHLIQQEMEFIACQMDEGFDSSKISSTTLTNATTNKIIASNGMDISPYNALYALEPNHGLEGDYTLSMLEGDKVVFTDVVKILKNQESFAETDGGLQVKLYELPTNTSKLPDFSSMEAKKEMTFANLDVAAQRFDVGFPGVENLFEWFGLTIEGQIHLDEDSTIKFAVLSDDGSKIYINDQLTIDHDGTHSPSRKESAFVTLPKGSHKIKVEYFQGPRHQVALQLMWQVNGMNEEIIPATAFVK